MSAHDQIRAMLDQLMGTARNGEEEKISIKFDDARVCKSFLLGCCPHEILASTRMDLGECPKLHNLALKADFEIANQERDYFYDLDALEQLSMFVAEADRKTDQARKRLAETQEELSTDVATKADKVHELAERIGENLAKAEQLGAEGLVEESMQLMEEIEKLRKAKSEAESEYRASIPAATYQQQKLRVCDVCCAYLGIHDNDRRLADHFGGKLHLGFIKIRDTLKDFQVIAEERRKKRRESMRTARQADEERARRPERDLRERDRGEPRERRRSKSRSPSRDRRKREEKRKRNRRSRSRSKDKDKKKRSSRSRSRERRRSHKKRSKSRSRSPRDRKSHHSRKESGAKGEGSTPPPAPSRTERRKTTVSMSEEESGEI